MAHSPFSYTLEQASQNSPQLATLWNASKKSLRLWQQLCSTLPEPMRGQLQAAGMEQGHWTLLAANASIAAKARQMLPDWLSTLQRNNPELEAIHISLRKPH